MKGTKIMDKRKKHTKFKLFYIVLAFMLLITETFIYVPSAKAEDNMDSPETTTKPVNTSTPEVTNAPEASVWPMVTNIPAASAEPVVTNTPEPSAHPGITTTPEPSAMPVVTNTPEPSKEPVGTSTPEPSSMPAKPVPKLKQVKGVHLTRYSTHSIKVTWKKHKKAKFYRVYYSKKKNSSGRLAGITKNTQYRVKNLKNNTSYYFYVIACKSKKASESDSSPSGKVHMKTRTYIRKTIFAGDSITKGIMDYGMLNRFSIKGQKKVVAAISLNTITFRTRRAFGGMTGLQKIIAEKPSRVYMMLGINEVYYRRTDDILSDYKTLVHAIKQSSPGTEVVICAISPVTRAEMARYNGYSRIPAVNKKLSKLAKKTNNRYFDYTGFLKDSGGYLKSQYATGDGYHWIPSAYIKFADIISKYDKSLDE